MDYGARASRRPLDCVKPWFQCFTAFWSGWWNLSNISCQISVSIWIFFFGSHTFSFECCFTFECFTPREISEPPPLKPPLITSKNLISFWFVFPHCLWTEKTSNAFISLNFAFFAMATCGLCCTFWGNREFAKMKMTDLIPFFGSLILIHFHLQWTAHCEDGIRRIRKPLAKSLWHSESVLFNCVDSRGVEASWHQPQVGPLSTKDWVANVQLFCSIVSYFPGSSRSWRDTFPLRVSSDSTEFQFIVLLFWSVLPQQAWPFVMIQTALAVVRCSGAARSRVWPGAKLPTGGTGDEPNPCICPEPHMPWMA